MHRSTLILLAVLFFFIHANCLAENFPYRENYPEVNIIELAALKAGFDSGDYIFVDVHSPAEFNAIQIKNTVNLPYTNAKFTEHLLQLSHKNPDKKIVVYCNGTTCIKNYNARLTQ